MKFYNSDDYINSYGILNSLGTEENPVIFTSYKDDLNGGDSNGDGSQTQPSANDWEYIKLYNKLANSMHVYQIVSQFI